MGPLHYNFGQGIDVDMLTDTDVKVGLQITNIIRSQTRVIAVHRPERCKSPDQDWSALLCCGSLGRKQHTTVRFRAAAADAAVKQYKTDILYAHYPLEVIGTLRRCVVIRHK